MRQWPVLSNEWSNRSGMTIRPVGNTEETEELGRQLNNGLRVPVESGMNPYPALCERGARQIVGVRDAEDNLVANAFLSVANGKLNTVFVRGDRNVELNEGPAFEAVSQYVSGINAGLIPTTVAITGNSFAVYPRKDHDDAKAGQTLWERSAVEGGGFIAQFRSFVKNVVKGETIDDRPVSEPLQFASAPEVEGGPLPVITGPWKAPSGLNLLPLSSKDELRVCGEELENHFMLAGQRNISENLILSGRTQYVAVCDEGGPIAVCELAVSNGQVVPAACRMRAENDASQEVIKAVTAYSASINAGVIPTNYELGGAEFVVSTNVRPTPIRLEGVGSVAPALPKASRTGASFSEGVQGDLDDDDDEFYFDPDDDDFFQEALTGRRPEAHAENAERPSDGDAESELTWAPLISEPWTSQNGYEISVLNTNEDLRKLGETLNNALRDCSGLWAKKAVDGLSQVIVVKDSEGTIVANSELVVRNGAMTQAMGLLKQFNAPANEGPKLAAYEFLDEVNSGRLKTALEIGEDGFIVDKPENAEGTDFRPRGP